ncbi:MAG: AraC family transcriptional regulator [Capnocytophaga sp.]|nr:AraC family transcriptional regulator [Capnocytophaga sp.]
MGMVPLSKEFITYDYNDELVSYYTDIHTICEMRIENHSLIHIISGNLVLKLKDKTVVFNKGETVFLKRNHLLFKTKVPLENEPFRAISLHFKTEQLKNIYKNISATLDTDKKIALQEHYKVLPDSSFLTALFYSFNFYVENNVLLTPEIMQIKLYEAVVALLHSNAGVENIIFDFSQNWKIDLEKFMNEHFTDDLSVAEFAYYTGRSGTTFKKDFQKIFNMPPGKWIQLRRLEYARDLMMREQKLPSEVYIKVGFKNLSHFTTAFKKEFGNVPSSYFKKPK